MLTWIYCCLFLTLWYHAQIVVPPNHPQKTSGSHLILLGKTHAEISRTEEANNRKLGESLKRQQSYVIPAAYTLLVIPLLVYLLKL